VNQLKYLHYDGAIFFFVLPNCGKCREGRVNQLKYLHYDGAIFFFVLLNCGKCRGGEG